jgi:WD40 repeat protein
MEVTYNKNIRLSESSAILPRRIFRFLLIIWCLSCLIVACSGNAVASSQGLSLGHKKKLLATRDPYAQPDIGPISTIDWSNDGKYIAGSGSRVCLWNAKTYKRLYLIPESCTGLAFDPANSNIIALFEKNQLAIWNFRTHKLIARLTQNFWNILDINWSNDGRLIATRVEPFVDVWDIKTKKKIAELADHVMHGTDEAPNATSVAWRPDGRELAIGSSKVRIWNVKTGKSRTIFHCSDDFFDSLAWSPNGKHLVGMESEGKTYLWNFDRVNQTSLIDSPSSGFGIAWSSNGKYLAVARLNSIAIWSSRRRSKYIVNEFPDTSSLPWSEYTIAWSPDSKYVACGSGQEVYMIPKYSIALWNVQTKHKVILGHLLPPTTSLAWNPKGKILAVCYLDGSIKLWDMSTKKLLTTLSDSNN